MGGGLRALEDISTKHVNSFLDVFPISPQSPYYKYILPCELTNEYINANSHVCFSSVYQWCLPAVPKD